MKRATDVAALAALALVAIAMTSALWHPYALHYQLNGHSAIFDYFRQLSLDHSLRAGVLYPRWVPDAYYGYGSPLFHFYAPLPYYIGELFVLGGASIVASIKLTMVAGLVLSGWAMYAFARDFARPAVAALAGIAAMLAPYHLVDMLVRHAMGEHWAFVWVPLALWGLSGMRGGGGRLRFVAGALAVAALVLTHNVSAVLALGPLALWWAMLAIERRDLRAAVWGAGIVAFGLLVSMFFWAPMAADLDLVRGRLSLAGPDMRYTDHFVAPVQLVRPTWGYGSSEPGVEGDDMSFQLGLAHWLLVVVAVGVAIVSRRRRLPFPIAVWFGAAVGAGSLAMTLPVSAIVYRALPALELVQFPWRFLVFAVIGVSALAVAVDAIEPLTGGRVRSRWAAVWIAGIAVVACQPYIKPQFAVYDRREDDFTGEYAGSIWNMWQFHSFPGGSYPRLVHPFDLGGLPYFRAHGHAGAEDEYLPLAVEEKPESLPAALAAWSSNANELNASTVHVDARPLGLTDVEADVEAPAAGYLDIARFNFPGWQATVNGRPAETLTAPVVGTVRVPVPAGRSNVIVAFGTTPLRRATGWISFAALGLLALIAVWPSPRKHRP